MRIEDRLNTVPTTVRLLEKTKARLENAARLLKRPMNQIVENALDDYFRANGLIERYVVRVLKDHVVLMKFAGDDATLVDMEKMNGLPLSQVAEKYAMKLQKPVAVEEEGEQQ
jgi:hypothetical protein